MTDFAEHFWGEKNNGFDVLYHNMKYGHVATKELGDYIRERSSIEESCSKLLGKLAKQTNNWSTQGTFGPFWQVLRNSTEKLSNLHMQMVHRFQELFKEVNKYLEEQHKKHKSVKEDEASTIEVVQCIQSTTTALQKAKETYHARCLEFEKLKRDNGSPKDIEKCEAKYKKACDDYRTYVEKYSNVRNDFEKKMTLSCQHFQDLEEKHLRQMKEFVYSFVHVLENNHILEGQITTEFRHQCDELTIEKLLEQFIEQKNTGKGRPGPIEFEEVDLSNLPPMSPDQVEKNPVGEKQKKEGNNLQEHKSKPRRSKSKSKGASLLDLVFPSRGFNSSSNTTTTSTITKHTSTNSATSSITTNGSKSNLSRSTLRGSKWFLNRKKEKKKEKKSKKKKNDKSDNKDSESIDSNEEKKEGVSSNEEPKATPEIDDEGFSIKPENPLDNEQNTFYSSSDDESDEEGRRKIHVEIKPLSNCTTPVSASVDELRISVVGLSLSPQNTGERRRNSQIEEKIMKRSYSMSDPMSKPSTDLLGLNLFSQTESSASTPTGGYPVLHSINLPCSGAIPCQDSTPASTPQNPTTPGSNAGDSNDVFGGDTPGTPPTMSMNKRLNMSGNPLFPGPPARRPLNSRTGRMSPIPQITRADSIGSLTSDFKTTSMPYGASRGPSPLTIGMSDTIPLAVAFSETIHAYFKGTEESKCMVRILGDMLVSFPAGIVQVLTNNPSPAVLTFRIKNINKLDHILPNKQLITHCSDSNQNSSDSNVYEFNMPALTAHLRRQSDQNPTASFFNIDIVKYQAKTLPGAQSTPLQIVSYWKCESDTTDLKIDYKYNATSLASSVALLNISLAVVVDGGVTDMQSQPSGTWCPENQRAIWKMSELSPHAKDEGVGSLKAHFQLSSGPSKPSPVMAQFFCETTSLSGVDFELAGVGYRLSLIKKRCASGKYWSEPDTCS